MKRQLLRHNNDPVFVIFGHLFVFQTTEFKGFQKLKNAAEPLTDALVGKSQSNTLPYAYDFLYEMQTEI